MFNRSRAKLTDIGFHLEVVEDCHEEVGLRRRFPDPCCISGKVPQQSDTRKYEHGGARSFSMLSCGQADVYIPGHVTHTVCLSTRISDVCMSAYA